MFYVFRRLARSPGFSLLIVVTVAFAVGTNVGLFSVTRSVLLKALGVPQADRLLRYTLGSGSDTIPFSGPAYEALQGNPGFKDLALWHKAAGLVLQNPEGAQPVSGALVNGRFFSIMKLTPALGRFFDDQDDQPNGGNNGWQGVLGYGFWKTHYNLDSAVIDKSITINGASVHIIGVLPEEFGGLAPPTVVEMLLPRSFLSVTNPGQNRFARSGYFEWDIFGRLPETTTLDAIEANLHVIEPQVLRAADPTRSIFTPENFPGLATGYLMTVRSAEFGASHEQKIIGRPLIAMELLGVVLFALCICNLILLVAGRIARQSREAAIRAALGAGRRHIVGIAILEAVVLAIVGGAAASPIARGMAHVVSLYVQSTPGLESLPTVTPSLGLLLLGSAIGTIMALLTSAGAAFWQTARRPTLTFRTANVASTGRFSLWIVGIEVFTAILLIAVGAVGVIGVNWLLHQPSGFAADSVVSASLGLVHPGQTPQATNEKIAEIMNAIANAPGVEAVASINVTPLSGGSAKETYAIYWKDGSLHAQQGMWPATVSLHYFATAGTRVIRGRDFVLSDLGGVPVCLISRIAGRTLFATEDPLEKTIYSMGLESHTKPYCQVIGIVEDAHLKSMSEAPDNAVYKLTNIMAENILVRASTSTLAIQAIRNAVRQISPNSLSSNIDSLSVHIQEDLRITRLLALFVALCAGVTALIMAIGVFGILAIEVSARKRDIGIQISLGAGKWSVCNAVIKRFRKAIATGLAIGSLTAVIIVLQLTQRYFVSSLTGIGALVVGLLCVLLVILAALAVPVRRALSISPMECLRTE